MKDLKDISDMNDMSQNVKRRIHYAWFVLIGLCVMVGLAKAALNNTSSLFISPVSKDLHVGVGNLTLYLSISAIATLIFLPIGGKILAKFNAQIVLTIAIILQAGAFALFGMMHSVWGWYILSIPLAIGGVFTTIIAGPVLVERWFRKRNGFALGVMSAVGGIFGIFTQPVVGNAISHLGWRTAYYGVGIVAIIIIVPTILLLLRTSPAAKQLNPYGENMQRIPSAQHTEVNRGGITFKDAKKSPAFILLLLFFFMSTAVASFFMHLPTYLSDKGYDVAFAGTAMAAMAFGVFIGSLVFGYLSDHIGAKQTTLLAMIMGIISMVLLIAFSDSTLFILIAFILFGSMEASIGTLAPAVTSALFGSREYSQIYATASIGLAVAAIFALPMYGYLFDFTGSYSAALWVIIVLLALNMICVVMAFRSKDKMVKAGLWK